MSRRCGLVSRRDVVVLCAVGFGSGRKDSLASHRHRRPQPYQAAALRRRGRRVLGGTRGQQELVPALGGASREDACARDMHGCN